MLSSLIAPDPPSVAIELANRRVTVIEVGRGSRGSPSWAMSEPLPPDAIVPGISSPNIPNPRRGVWGARPSP
jgi:hypothetical protein